MYPKGLLSNSLCAACLFALAAPALASNVWFARDMPMSQMTEADRAVLSAAADEVLETGADGATQRWENPETGAGGLLTPQSIAERDGMRCRRLQIANEVKGSTARSEFDFCRQADGSWKVVSSPAAPAAASTPGSPAE
jgi:surface antigen